MNTPLFQIPALIVTAIVGALISYGIYEYVRKTPQSAPTVGAINVKGDVGKVSLSFSKGVK
jgi:hypothetical protein